MQPRAIRIPARREGLTAHPEAKNGKGRPLPRRFVERFQRFFTYDLRKVRIHRGIPARLRALAGCRDPIAVSYRDRIYIAPGYANLNTPSGLRTVLHELRHVDQWARYGDRVYREYARAARAWGYWANPWERDAYRHERRVFRAVSLARA